MTPYVKDPETGRSFDGRYDEQLKCGCVIFYRGGKVLCGPHGGVWPARDERSDAEKQADGGW